MKFLLPLFVFIMVSSINAATYYVSPTGSDTNSGSELSPFKTIGKAVGLVTAGDIIYLRGGKHAYTSTISISKSGNSTVRNTMASYPGERALLDFTGQAFGSRGISLSGSYWLFKNIDVCNSGDNGLYISGAYNVIDNCSFYNHQDSGVQLSGGAHHNQIVNCDSYWNADPTDYGDADGFAVKMDVGTGNYFYGCRAWLNVDDGWDGYMRGADDVSTVLENCWTWRNGWMKNGFDPGTQANGNGFKVGGSDDKTLRHNFILRNCLAFDNKSKGFDQNNNKGDMYFYNCTGYRNVGNNFSIPLALAAGKVAEVKNSVAVDGKINLGSFVVQERNGWLAPFVTNSADFVSLDTTGVSGLRQADGSLPVINFARLAPGSDLIDAGLLLPNIAYLGSAPDLGAFEFVPTTGVYLPKREVVNTVKHAVVVDNQLRLVLSVDDQPTGIVDVYNVSGIKVLSVPYAGNAGLLRMDIPWIGDKSGFFFVSIRNSQSPAYKFIVK